MVRDLPWIQEGYQEGARMVPGGCQEGARRDARRDTDNSKNTKARIPRQWYFGPSQTQMSTELRHIRSCATQEPQIAGNVYFLMVMEIYLLQTYASSKKTDVHNSAKCHRGQVRMWTNNA